jgi:predicted RNase H-like HicB family nuclease
MKVIYEAVLSPWKDLYEARFPSWDDATTQGSSYIDAIEMAADFLRGLVIDALAAGEDLPARDFSSNLGDHEQSVVLALDISSSDLEWIPSEEAAYILGITPGRVRALANTGKLPTEKRGRDLYVSRTAVEARKANPPRRGKPKRELAAA